MCVQSMIIDHFDDSWSKKLQGPQIVPYKYPVVPSITPEEVEEFRRLLERAKEYDKRNNEPDCEMESKKKRILELAKELGVEINFL